MVVLVVRAAAQVVAPKASGHVFSLFYALLPGFRCGFDRIHPPLPFGHSLMRTLVRLLKFHATDFVTASVFLSC